MRQRQHTRAPQGGIPGGSFFDQSSTRLEKGIIMDTVTQPIEPRKNDLEEEPECFDLLLRHKRTALAATAWECYIRAGRGALLTNGNVTEYLPRGVIKRHPGIASATRQVLRQELKTYNPRREVLLVIPWSNRPWTIKHIVTEPGPETAFLQRVGTDGLPPLQVVMSQPWHGHRSGGAVVGT